MLGLLGILTAGLLNVGYLVAAGYLSHAWSNGNEGLARKYHYRFALAWLVVVAALYVYSRYF